MMPSLVKHYNREDPLGTQNTTQDSNFDTEHPLYQAIREFSTIYHQHPALRHGDQTVLLSEKTPGIFMVERNYKGKHYIVVLNTSTETKTAKTPILNTNAVTLLNSKPLNMSEIELAPLHFEIIQID